ncbi:MAG: nucleotidyltransferase family protein [Candidatus Competibacter sp.]|nr:nucleotidyltransferase family protein [Candidatus Competibacter sp.]MDG4585609.1 nucleotidyltransferase family protein [Candidatus Competibacter sp.]
MKSSLVLSSYSAGIRDLISRHHVVNPRVFGSVLHGTDEEGSDLDLLVDPLPGTTLFDLGGLQVALEDLLGVPVDVVTPGDLPARIRARVVAEARPL